ncbi:MAG: sigma-70 family RNA polymerase sigma factor [Fimbriimonadaceae bacterium]
MDQQAFEIELQPILEMAYAYAYKMTRDREAASDLVQDAAVQAFRSRHTFQPGTNFRAWFLKVMTNRFLKERSKAKRRGPTLSLDEAEDAYLFMQTAQAGLHLKHENPAETVMDKMDVEAVEEALEQLPEEFRQVALLYFLNEFSYEEIAKILDVPSGTVRSRLHRSRKLLQKALWNIAVSRGLVEEMAKAEAVNGES